MSQQYSLRWNNHQPNFISMFTTLLNTQTLVDVTLAAEGKHLQAHKIVLSACSTYFHSLFVDNPSSHPIVILKDVKFNDLRTMVDFMYCGVVNVTEEQLPQVLDTAKVLKIKGLTEMPDSTSLTRSQGTSADFQSPGDHCEQRHSASPANSPSSKRKRRRKSSSGSTCMNTLDDSRNDEAVQTVDLMRGDAITLSSVPQRQRMDSVHQSGEQHNMSMESLGMDNSHASLAQESFNSALGLRRRGKTIKRQSRVEPDEREVRKQISEPALSSVAVTPSLTKQESYPQYKNNRQRSQESTGLLLIRRMPSSTETSIVPVASASGESALAQRASHTPAVRSGPPLSCNFCWNTVDESGRILRRKTQYHCPECRTNLCIVPCFHEYHDGSDPESARSDNTLSATARVETGVTR